MVGIVLVSHSRPLAEAALKLVQSVSAGPHALALAAGIDEDQFGTDATAIAQAIELVMSEEGVLVLMDLGSAVLSAETALELIDESMRPRVRLCPAPFIEGALAAGVTAGMGGSLDQVAHEAQQALQAKQEHLHPSTHAAASAEAPPAGIATAILAPASIALTVSNPQGLHLRPAARLVQEASRFSAIVTVQNITVPRGPVSARSLSALAALEVLKGHTICVIATGQDAEAALQAIADLVASGMGDALEASPAALPAVPAGKAQPISEGIVMGQALFAQPHVLNIPQDRATSVEHEKRALRTALSTAHAGLLRAAQPASLSGKSVAGEGIFAALAALLADPGLVERAELLIDAQQLNAAMAWHQACGELADQYQQLKDEYLRQRAADIRSVGHRVLAELGVKTEADLPVDRPGILVVDDLSPMQVSQLTGSQIRGVVCLDGGRTSHSAILLRAMELPSVAQARAVLGELTRTATVAQIAFDGATGEIWVNPDEDRAREIQIRQKTWEAARLDRLARVGQPAITTDGHTVELMANVAQPADAAKAIACGAQGIGLLRTEFLFLDRAGAPSEQEQIAALEPTVQAMAQRPIVIRTLDAGGDKELGYLNLPHEANPFLGVRALRVCLRRPDLFQTQLRALLRVGAGHDLRIMFPMVSEPGELQAALQQLEAAHAALAAEGLAHAWPVHKGIMVEVPSAALLADELAALCDFFSIGTNDLTQYTLAADRGNPQLSAFQDALHPAVLRLIRQVVQAAHRHRRRVAVCGEAAGDPQAALIFAGLGVDELSMTPPAIPQVKEALRSVSLAELRKMAGDALRCQSAGEVRAQALPQAGSAISKKPARFDAPPGGRPV